MSLFSKHPVPWTALGNREIGDGAGNVTQYDLETLSAICMAVNSYGRMREALIQIGDIARGAGDAGDNAAIRAIVSVALGKIGLAALAAAVEAASGPDTQIDAAIATELQCSPMRFTGDMNAAMALVPAGWRVSWSGDGAGTETQWIVEITSPDSSRSIKAAASSIPLALCAASLTALG